MIDNNGIFLLQAVLAFLIGAVPFAWIVARLKGIKDLTNIGSGNVGTTNVVRTAGWLAGGATFLLDFSKGFFCYYFPIWFGNSINSDAATVGLVFGVLAVAGHCYSPFLKFKGGKGVATTMGLVTAFFPVLGLAIILVYGLALGITKVSALGSFYCMITLAVASFLFKFHLWQSLILFFLSLFILSKHHENWKKILNSTLLIAFALISNSASGIEKQFNKSDFQFVDFVGSEIVFKKTPLRIVALMPSLAEIVQDLGFSSSLVGVPEFTRLEKKSSNIVVLGPYTRISPESVYSLKPDLILANKDGNFESLIEQLKKLELKTVVLDTTSLNNIYRSIKIVNFLLTGSKVNSKIEESFSFLSNKSATRSRLKNVPTVFVSIGWNPLVTIGKNNFINEVINYAGGKNVFEDQAIAYPRPSFEQVLARDPDFIILCDLTIRGSGGGSAHLTSESALQFNAQLLEQKAYFEKFKNLKATKKHRIFLVAGDILLKPGFNLVHGYNYLTSKFNSL